MSLFKKAAEAIGVETVDTNAQEQAAKKDETHKQEIINVYWWLRQSLDAAIDSFYRTGDFAELEKVVGGDVLVNLKEVLLDYHNKNLVWSMPNRETVTKPNIKVISEADGSFTCEESFYDFSTLQLIDPSTGSVLKESKNNGAPKISQATFMANPNDPSHYYFTNFYTVGLEED